MALLNTANTTITAAQYQVLQDYINDGDRVAFYTALYEMTGNDAAFLMSHISSQSDIAGGVAWLMNETCLVCWTGALLSNVIAEDASLPSRLP